MKLISYLHEGREGFGAITDAGVVDLTGLSYPNLAGLLGDADGIGKARAAIGNSPSTIPLERVTLHAPIPRPGKVICIGLNYSDHAKEGGAELPKKQVMFAKWPTSITDPGAAIALVTDSDKIDYEAELVAVIGRTAKNVPPERAMDHVAGYTIANDVSARDVQLSEGGQWTRGKAFDDFAPMGPWLVTADEIPDPQTLDIELELNGTIMQRSNTSNMIFGVRELVSFLSRGVTLEPGDVVLTGTPEGVGVFRDPPVLLKPGDVTKVRVAGLGELVNTFKAA